MHRRFPGQSNWSAGLKTGIVTNGRDAFQRSKIKGLGLDSLVDCIVTSGGLGIKKPDPAIFLHCLHTLGVGADKTAFVGDDFDADIQPAYKLEMLPIWKSTSSSCIAVLSSDSLYEIKDYLLRMI
jgi:putative hydrolase of the HAD superfamily